MADPVADIAASFGTFADAVEMFRSKLNVPTATWRDLWQGQHARAFTVAGALRTDLLADLREAVDTAISSGESLEQFRARFDAIVERYGWAYNGGRNWRSNVIYTTNLRTSYMRGRWKTLQTFDYLRYQHNTVENPRLDHKAWDDLIIARDDPWWAQHFPPNGWGCRCSVTGVSRQRLRAMRREPDRAPAPVEGDPPPEWAYHVGRDESPLSGSPPPHFG